MLSNGFLCPRHFLNLTDLSPSGPARRFAEPDLGLNCLYDQSRTFHFKMLLEHTINVLLADSFLCILFYHHNQIIGAYWVLARTVWIQIRPQVLSKIVSEYDQKILQSQTKDKSMAPRGRATKPSRDTKKTN